MCFQKSAQCDIASYCAGKPCHVVHVFSNIPSNYIGYIGPIGVSIYTLNSTMWWPKGLKVSSAMSICPQHDNAIWPPYNFQEGHIALY